MTTNHFILIGAWSLIAFGGIWCVFYPLAQLCGWKMVIKMIASLLIMSLGALAFIGLIYYTIRVIWS